MRAIDIVKFFGDRRVLDGITFTASPGRRIGLVGENGAGKSTLLRLLAGADTPDAGQIIRPAATGMLHQELPFPGHHHVGDVIDDALAETRDLLHRLDTLLHQPENLDEYARVLTRAEETAAWDAEHRAAEILHGLGIGDLDRRRRLDTISGGQRSRLALAALLTARPTALLLDEPTNHLDDQAIAFLEQHLRTLPGTVIAASHDRVFLDRVCTDIIDIDPTRAGITRYGGAYTEYLHAKKAERTRWEQAFAAQQDEMNALRHTIATTARQVAHNRPPRDGNKLGYNAAGEKVQASIASRVRNAGQRLEVLQRKQIRKPPPILHFQAPQLSAAPETGELLISGRALDVPGRLSLDRIDLAPGAKLLITGPNGAGKSTLLHLLAGNLTPATGTLLRRKGLRTGLLAQDDTWPDLTATPRQLYHGHTPLADLGLIAPRDLDRPIGALSAGQRRRLALAVIIADPPHLLLLDEPTNHLSLTLTEELETALEHTPGAVVIASHDRWLRQRWRHHRLDL